MPSKLTGSSPWISEGISGLGTAETDQFQPNGDVSYTSLSASTRMNCHTRKPETNCQIYGPSQAFEERSIFRKRLPVVLENFAVAGRLYRTIRTLGWLAQPEPVWLVPVRRPGMVAVHLHLSDWHSGPSHDPCGFELRPLPDEQVHGSHYAPACQQARRIRNGHVGARGAPDHVQVEHDDKGHDEPSRPVEPGAARVRDGEPQRGHDEGAEQAVGQHEGHGAILRNGKLEGEALGGADCLAEVVQRSGHSCHILIRTSDRGTAES